MLLIVTSKRRRECYLKANGAHRSLVDRLRVALLV